MKISEPNHPLNSYADVIEKRGIVVFEKVNTLLALKEPYATSNMAIGLNLGGHLKAECDMKEVDFKPHDIAVLGHHQVLTPIDATPDHHIMLVALSRGFQDELRRLYPDIYRSDHNFIHCPSFHLNDNQFEVIHRIFKLLRDVSLLDNPNYKLMAGRLLEVLFIFVLHYRRENGIDTQPMTAEGELFANFYDALVDHYTESREVRFYAELMCISPKYFSSVIKQHTGLTVAQWISNYVIIQAKSLLRHHRHLSIQQVALRLGFTDQSAFSRYFRDRTGLSPSAYRAR